jgi:hypothetical protein
MLDSDGKRLAARYFTPEWPGLEKQLSFEKSLFTKAQAHPAGTFPTTAHSTAPFSCSPHHPYAAEIILLDNIIGVQLLFFQACAL